MERPNEVPPNTTYELFIAAISVQAILNMFLIYLIVHPNVQGVVVIMDGLLSVIFLADFLYRFVNAQSKPRYFLRHFGWADLLSSLPFAQAKLLRLFRIVQTGRMYGKRSARSLVREFVANRSGSALLALLFFMMLVLEFGGIGILAAESLSPDANIKTAGDALWYIYVTITTVGYGDRFPVTPLGRFVGIIVLTTGVGLFGTLTAFLANAFLASPQDRRGATKAIQPQELEARLERMMQLLAEQQKAQIELREQIAEMERSRTQVER
jgi:voltage-gated potassium channel